MPNRNLHYRQAGRACLTLRAGRGRGWAALGFSLLLATLPAAGDETAPRAREAPMDESLRAPLQRIVVVPAAAPTDSELKGDYEKTTMGLYGGMAAGSAAATPTVQMGPVAVGFPIPVLALPGMLAGGAIGATQREIQEFRDALAEEIADDSRQPLNNDKLARYVYQSLRSLPQPAAGLLAPSTAVPGDTDAILRIDIPGMSIDVEGDEAVLSTAGRLVVEGTKDGGKLYERTVAYRDRAPLSRWTENGHQLLTDYANYALHYLGRELADAALSGADIVQAFQPMDSPSLKLERKNPWRGKSRSPTPTLAWATVVTETAGVPAPVAWDVEIYDEHRPVYTQRGVREASHTLATPLESCGHYRWSVRPAYDVDGQLRYGEWMRRPLAGDAPAIDGLAGRNAAEAPAYTQDFAALEIDCKAR
jgi:hypothetical protein